VVSGANHERRLHGDDRGANTHDHLGIGGGGGSKAKSGDAGDKQAAKHGILLEIRWLFWASSTRQRKRTSPLRAGKNGFSSLPHLFTIPQARRLASGLPVNHRCNAALVCENNLMSPTLTEKLNAFDATLPLARARTIPSAWYFDPEIYALE